MSNATVQDDLLKQEEIERANAMWAKLDSTNREAVRLFMELMDGTLPVRELDLNSVASQRALWLYKQDLKSYPPAPVPPTSRRRRAREIQARKVGAE